MIIENFINELYNDKPLKNALVALKPEIVRRVQREYDKWRGGMGICDYIARTIRYVIEEDIPDAKVSIIDKESFHYWVRVWLGKECYDVDIPFGKYERYNYKNDKFIKIPNVVFNIHDIFIYRTSTSFLKAPWEIKKSYVPHKDDQYYHLNDHLLVKESPDFNYTRFNNRDEAIKKIKFKEVESNYLGEYCNITAFYKNDDVGVINLFKYKPDSEVIVESIEIKPRWKGTGLGQLLYEKGIAYAKKNGFENFCSDTNRSDEANKAWQRLSQRYPVRLLKIKIRGAMKNRYEIDLSKVPLKESIIFEEPDFGYKTFNNRDEELEQLKFRYEVKASLIAITIYKNSDDSINQQYPLGVIEAIKDSLCITIEGEDQSKVNSWFITVASIPNDWRGTGLGQILYEKMIIAVRSVGGKYLWSDVSLNKNSRSAWERLSKRFTVLKIKNRYRMTIPEKQKRLRIKESPDYGYKIFNNREEEISKLKWVVIHNEDGIIVKAVEENRYNRPSGDSIYGNYEGLIVARPIPKDATIGKGIQITLSKLHNTQTKTWQSTGLGQMLYDRIIQEAKKAGYDFITSDFDRSLDANKAWKKICQRYNVTKVKAFDGDKYFRIDLEDVPNKINEDIGNIVKTKSLYYGSAARPKTKTELLINNRVKGEIYLSSPMDFDNDDLDWSFDVPIEKTEMITYVDIDPIYRNRGYGKLLYNAAMKNAKQRGIKIIISGMPQSSDALRVWNSLAREGKVKKNHDWGMYIDLENISDKINESPDFGYQQFNNRDVDFKKIKFETEMNATGFFIFSYFDGRDAGHIGCTIREKLFPPPKTYKVSQLVIIQSVDTEKEWRGTGLGQTLYDMAIKKTKELGYKYFRSDISLSNDAFNAWKKLSQRYPVTKYLTSSGKPYFEIDLENI